MMKKTISIKELAQKLGPLIALAVTMIVFAVLVDGGKFLLVSNQMNILKQASLNCLIAVGMLLCLITAGIDLSVGSNTVLCACTIGVLMQNFGILNPVVLIICGVFVSTCAGVLNGVLLTRLDLPHPFVSTLGIKNVLLGVALVITSSTSIGFTNKGVDSLLWFGSATVGKFGSTNAGFPISFILVVIVYIIFDIFLKRTALGRKIYCVGGNGEAARLSGIDSKNVLTIVYGISGFMCGLAGVVMCGRVATANATAGTTYDTDAIAACIIGGASFTGGKGTIWGTMIGALLMAVIRNGLNLMGASNDVQYIVIGAVIIIAVTIDVVRNKMEAKARRLAAV